MNYNIDPFRKEDNDTDKRFVQLFGFKIGDVLYRQHVNTGYLVQEYYAGCAFTPNKDSLVIWADTQKEYDERPYNELCHISRVFIKVPYKPETLEAYVKNEDVTIIFYTGNGVTYYVHPTLSSISFSSGASNRIVGNFEFSVPMLTWESSPTTANVSEGTFNLSIEYDGFSYEKFQRYLERELKRVLAIEYIPDIPDES